MVILTVFNLSFGIQKTEIFSDLFCCAVKTHGTQNEFKTLAMCLFLIWSASIHADLLFNLVQNEKIQEKCHNSKHWPT